ncbi:hypothetical protein HNR39_000546 [Glaciimonas immobilis]|uniref:Uncharacterized protein n=1 Tax=Glaciimonas immobilis TaxID=728004 RepID=A0A840RP11_9BURK|nr:hypothetical protein [Glaciimonas immobilis]
MRASWQVQIHAEDFPVRPFTQRKRRNCGIATLRARIKNVFRGLSQMGGKLMCCIGGICNPICTNLKAGSYNAEAYSIFKRMPPRSDQSEEKSTEKRLQS